MAGSRCSSFFRHPRENGNPGVASIFLDSGSPLCCARNDGHLKLFGEKKLEHRVDGSGEIVEIVYLNPNRQQCGGHCVVLGTDHVQYAYKCNLFRISDLVRGKWEKFSLEMLIILATRAGMHVSVNIAA